MNSIGQKKRMRVLVFIVAYNASAKIRWVLDRIPRSLSETYDLQVLLIDDCSADNTVEVARAHVYEGYWCPIKILRNPVNQGYGGNQKIGYRYASQEGFDVVALLHGDGQYAPESLPELIAPFVAEAEARPSAVFGSRMMDRMGAIKGGMPFYKYVGNKILTRMQNSLLKSDLSEFHSGYRLYSVDALRRVPYELNTNDFHFDTEIIVQMLYSGGRILEIPIPTHYGDEVCHVNGMRYAWDVFRASVKARLIAMGVFHDPKFDVQQQERSALYVSKLDFNSTHSAAFNAIPEGSIVLDVGCADGFLSERLASLKGCEVYAADLVPDRIMQGCHYQACDLNSKLPDVPWGQLDVVLLLDVIEHLNEPERFLERLRDKLSSNDKVRVIMSSGNVCFFVTRMMMLFGEFNYGKRGILDMTHTRLFNGKSLKRLCRYAAFDVLSVKSIPAPYPLAIGFNKVSRAMLAINAGLARWMSGLFAYQVFLVIKPRPSVAVLLERALGSERKTSQ
jgi:glycosyltransferase involved in cell wall biosynthesis